MSESKYIYIVYKTTNLVNQKIYIGKHKQNFHFPVIFDGYLGSGKTILKAIKKYGSENFIRETLHVFYTAKEALEKEAELVDETFVNRKDTYNLCGGGKGPSYFSENSKQKISKKCKMRFAGGFVPPNKIEPPTKEDLVYLYIEQKFSMTKIGKMMEVTIPTVRKWLNSHCIKLRSPSERITEEAKLASSKRFKGQKRSESDKQKMRKPKSKQGKENIRESIVGRPKITCPHCGKESNVMNIKRWHMDNCKFKLSE